MSTPENKIVPAASPGRRAGGRGRGRGAHQVSRPLQLPAPLPEPAQDPGMSARVEQQLALAESSRPMSTQSTPRRSPQELVPRSTQSSPGRPTLREVPALPQPPLELALSPAAESTLGKRDHLALRGHHETTVPDNGAPVRLGLAPGAQVLGPELPAPRGHALPRGSLPVIPRGVYGEAGAGGGQLVSVADDEARAYGAEQLRRWVALPGEVISPVDIVYDEAEDEYDMEAWVKAALETSRYLGLVNAGRLSESWIKMLSVRRRRQPLVTDLRAISVSPKLLPLLSCVALLQTMLMEAGFEFCNVVPIWSSIPELSAVPESQIRRGVEEVQARIALECLEWNKLMRGVGFHIRQPLDPLPEVRPVSPDDNQARDEEGDILMTDDTVELLGLELVRRLRITRTRRRSPASSASGQPQPKRPALESQRAAPMLQAPRPPPQSPLPPVTGPLVPVTGMEAMAREDSAPSVVGPSGDSGQSMHVGEATDLSGHSSSGSSFLSAADYLAGSALSHMPGPGPVAMVMIAQTSSAAAADPQGFGVSVPVAAYPRSPEVTQRQPAPVQNLPPEQAPLPESPEGSSRAAPQARSRESPARTQEAHGSRHEPRPRGHCDSRDGSAVGNVPTQGVTVPTRPQTVSQVVPDAREARNESVHSVKSSRKSSSKSSARSSSSRMSSRVSSRSSARSGASEVALIMLRQQEAALKQQEAALNHVRETMTAELREMRVTAQQEKDSLLERLQRSEAALVAEQEARVQEAKLSHVSHAHVAQEAREQSSSAQAASHVASHVASLPPNTAEAHVAQESAAALEAAATTVMAAAAQVKEEQDALDRRAEEYLMAYEERLRQANTAYLQKNALAQKIQRERDEMLRNQSHKSDPTSHACRTSSSVAGQAQSDANHARQLQATLPTESVPIKGETRASAPKQRKSGAKAGTSTVKTETTSADPTAVKQTSGSANQPAGSKKSSIKSPAEPAKSKTRRDRRGQRSGGYPPDDGPSSSDDSSSSEGDGFDSDSDWERELEEELAPTTVAGNAGSSFTFRPYVQYSAVEKFDPDAKLEDRVNWWERFHYAASLGAWPETMKLRQLQSRLPAPIRAWYKQLPERDQKSWSRLSKLFRREYCRTEASPYDRYYELSPDSGETARSFLYRLNAAAKRADVDYEGSASDRELHIRRFIKKISDRRLKITLQGQRFLSIRELEKTLKRVEAVQRNDDGYETPPPRSRDHKTHGVRFSRFPSQRRGQPERAYLSAGEDSDSEDEDTQAQESEEKSEPVHRPGTPPPVSSRPTATVNVTRIPEVPAPVPRAPTTEEIFRAVEQMGWRPPLPPAPPQSPRRDNNVFCEKCRTFGHTAQYCWQDVICDRCHEAGHPTHRCNRRPCSKCGDFHREGLCADWAALKAVRELARKGALQDLPDDVLKQLLKNEKGRSGTSLND